MPPIRVKVYGLLSMSKAGYLTVQAVGLVVLLALDLYLFFLMPRPHIPPGVQPSLTVQVSLWLFDALPWLLLGGVAYEALETWLVLRRFAREEARLRTLESVQAPPTDEKKTPPDPEV
jgi:hypothetical protein